MMGFFDWCAFELGLDTVNLFCVDYTPWGYYHECMIVDLKKRALHRSKIIQGQLKGVEKMIADEKYCMDIITQNLAIQKSLGSLNKLILENHLRTHISDTMASTDDEAHTKTIEELLSLYELTQVRSK